MISTTDISKPEDHMVSAQEIAAFQKDGYVYLPKVIESSVLSMLSNYYWLLMRNRGHFVNDGHAHLSRYGDLFNESWLTWFKPSFEALSGRTLFPTYSYMRIYNQGNFLSRHVDRVGCEYAATISIDYDPAPWPFFVKGTGEEQSYNMNKGDIIFYKGHDIEHWREPYDGKTCIQVFLFYVDANGAYKEWKYDKRSALGTPEIKH